MDLCLDLNLLWYFWFHKDSWNVYHVTNFSTHVIKEGRFLACVRLAFWDRRRGFLYVLHFENNKKYYETVHTIKFPAKLSVNLIYLFSELAFSGSVTAFPQLYWNGFKGPNFTSAASVMIVDYLDRSCKHIEEVCMGQCLLWVQAQPHWLQSLSILFNANGGITTVCRLDRWRAHLWFIIDWIGLYVACISE